MKVNDSNDIADGYDEFEREMDAAISEMDQIDDVIDKREKEMEDFHLPKDFVPHLTSENEDKIIERCNAMQEEMLMRGFAVELDENTPLKVFYLYLQYVALITEGLEMPGNWISTFGCKYWCKDCFQREWCTLREDIEMEEMRISK